MTKKLIKLEGVDILDTLGQIMMQNTTAYQEDFESDKDIIQRAAANPSLRDDSLLWMCRPHGTYCFRESDVFIQETYPYNVWLFYGENKMPNILAYALCKLHIDGDVVVGDIYELDYQESWEMVKENACAPGFYRVQYEGGLRDIPFECRLDGVDDEALGKYVSHRILPMDKQVWEYALRKAAKSREKNIPGYAKCYIEELREARI